MSTVAESAYSLSEGSNTQITWSAALAEEREREYFKTVLNFVNQERQAGKTIYPPKERTFEAFRLTPLESTKVVILGQDPYHAPGQAHGLSFSVQDGVRHPPSLGNIFKELYSDLGREVPTSGNLERWANQGILLLNSVLTVERGKPGSHATQGWERFTDYVISAVNQHTEHVVFILWGRYAQNKAHMIDRSRHLIIESPHPSPFSARNGFFGSRPFSRTNQYLIKHNKSEIDW